jgi:hypothetical protein
MINPWKIKPVEFFTGFLLYSLASAFDLHYICAFIELFCLYGIYYNYRIDYIKRTFIYVRDRIGVFS